MGDEYRVIKVSKTAIYELIRESITDKLQDYFDIEDITSWRVGWYWDGDDLTVTIHERKNAINMSAIRDRVPYTTDSLYDHNQKCYKTIKETDDGAIILVD